MHTKFDTIKNEIDDLLESHPCNAVLRYLANLCSSMESTSEKEENAKE